MPYALKKFGYVNICLYAAVVNPTGKNDTLFCIIAAGSEKESAIIYMNGTMQMSTTNAITIKRIRLKMLNEFFLDCIVHSVLTDVFLIDTFVGETFACSVCRGDKNNADNAGK